MATALKIFRTLGVLGLGIWLSGCVPTVTTVYQGPALHGRLVALSDLQPVEGVQVYYPEHIQHSVATNALGIYDLPAPISTQATLLMAGHALTTYQALVRKAGYESTTLVAQGSLKMLSPEHVQLDAVVLDDSPGEIAEPTIEGGSAYGLVKTFFYAHSLFSSCDRSLGWDAFIALNVYRKLYWRYHQAQADGSKDAEELATLLLYRDYARLHTARLWEATRWSCPLTELRAEQYQEIDAIAREIGGVITN